MEHWLQKKADSALFFCIMSLQNISALTSFEFQIVNVRSRQLILIRHRWLQNTRRVRNREVGMVDWKTLRLERGRKKEVDKRSEHQRGKKTHDKMNEWYRRTAKDEILMRNVMRWQYFHWHPMNFVMHSYRNEIIKLDGSAKASLE